MSSKHVTTLDILTRWPSRKSISEDTGASLTAVHRWFIRERIPGDWDVDLVGAAERRGIKLTYEELAAARQTRMAGSAA